MPSDDLDLLAVLEEPTPEADLVAAALADLRKTERRCRTLHYSDCLCGALAARTIATLTGKDTT